MRNFSIILVLGVILISCKLIYHTAPKYLKNHGFTYRYSDKSSKLEEKLNINVFFTLDTLNDIGRIPYARMLFFKDGMFVTEFYNHYDIGQYNIEDKTVKYLDSILYQRKKGIREDGFYERSEWGYYQVHGDTIKVQHIDRPALGESRSFWYAYEIWFKILNRNTVKEIYRYPIHKSTNADIQNFKISENLRIPVKAYFKPLKEVPESDGWLKYEKWFWEDKNQYTNWKNNITKR